MVLYPSGWLPLSRVSSGVEPKSLTFLREERNEVQGARQICGKGRWPYLKTPWEAGRSGEGPVSREFSWLCSPGPGWWSACQIPNSFLKGAGSEARVISTTAGTCQQVAPVVSRLCTASEPGLGPGTPAGRALKPILDVPCNDCSLHFMWLDFKIPPVTLWRGFNGSIKVPSETPTPFQPRDTAIHPLGEH